MSMVCFLTFLTGCPFTSGDNTLVLATDHPELAAYVEIFNAQQEDIKVELVYHENPTADISGNSAEYDIIFSEGLTDNVNLSSFAPLEELFTEYGIKRESFYRESLATGIVEEKQTILPVSFTLPAILIQSGSEPEAAEGFMLSLDTMKEECRIFNEGSSERFPVMGFSPRWTADFLYCIARIHNSRFRESTEGSIVWNRENLERSINYSRDWIDNINGGSGAEKRFRETYLYDPGYKLVFSGRIRFYPVEYPNFLLIPADIRRDVDFLWLSDGQRIPINEDIVYAGIIKKPGNRKAALSFLAWFFNADTQEKLLESSQFKRIRSFGIAGGFSSLRDVNELILPKYFPGITGRVPAPSQLTFPPALPENWDRIKKEVIIPYLGEQSISDEDTTPLEDRLLTWYTQQVP